MTPIQDMSYRLSLRLRDLIKTSGLSVSDVSKRAYVGKYFIYDVLSGKSANPSPVKLARIAKVLRVKLERLIDEADDKMMPQNEKNSGVKASQVVPADILIKLSNGDKLRPFDDVLQDIFVNALKCCDGNKTKAADSLGMSRSRFYRRLGAFSELRSQMHREKQSEAKRIE
jgi:transcriptional regulator with XRE-family HTH domain